MVDQFEDKKLVVKFVKFVCRKFEDMVQGIGVMGDLFGFLVDLVVISGSVQFSDGKVFEIVMELIEEDFYQF